MDQADWRNVRKDMGVAPIVEGLIEGPVSLFVERYLFQTVECRVGGIPLVALCTQFGGREINEGSTAGELSRYLPTQSGLLPPGVPSHWHYSSTVDFALIYILETDESIVQHLYRFARSHERSLGFSDPLVDSLAHGIVDELQKGAGADQQFLGRMAYLLVEQSFRRLTTPSVGSINPRHLHYSRLQAVLNHIHSHLEDELSLDLLAAKAGISTAHFRDIFEQAVGTTPHRYVMSLRIERARKLLSQSTWPISQIAQVCGFSSQSHLTASFRAVHGVTPARFRAAAHTD